ncbi:ABC transporter substrate-binding protein [Lacicoccus alkaliphilus]|uniref:Peptide/nickel transport system substrate-binding protein n=1 Tax=Lacicoccus alkaliphilus DSM 16010 TaxID=1123231 RepID=A0A1M7CUY3_9BACL|nr:ABC transporter substrate-binding protein [Salinicoccus alkaliphilus]SHL71138.1 peptide/nickel transport system substrate-binding protein [Salinicoccus alkaliphilus DSM 16010]
MKQRKFHFTVLMLALLFVLAACTDDADVEDDAQEDGAGEAEAQEEDIVIGMMREPVAVDPHGSNDIPSAQVRTQIFDTLIHQNAEMELEPGLAESWEQEEDDLWRFELKEGVTFHNGSDFTAEDVEATLDRMLDPTVASTAAFLFEVIEDVEVVGDHELLMHTEYAFAPLLNHLAHNTSGILSKEVIDEDYESAIEAAELDLSLEEYYELREEGGDEFEEASEAMSEHIGSVVSDNPDGTGHLQFESRDPGSEIVLEKFEDYHGGERNFGTVTYRVIPENAARLAELETGGIMITEEVDADNIDRVRDHEDTDVIDQDGLGMTYLAFHTENEPFDDPNVRRAISSAIDRESIIEGVLNDRGTHASSHISPAVNGHADSLEEIEYDMEQAREYLAETDVADGFDTTLWVSDSEETVNIAIYIQETLGELGIEAEIEQFEYGAFLDKAREGTHDMFILGWVSVTGDADYGLHPMFHTDSQDGSGNRWFYSNTELDGLLDQAQQSSDEGERETLYEEAQLILREDLPVAPLYYAELGIGVNETLIEDVELDPVGIIRLENVTFPE